MNVIKTLKKQIEVGNTLILADGTTVKPENANKALMKNYLAGIKDGSIGTDVSFKDYAANNQGDTLTVQELIDFIENGDEEPADEE